MVQIHDLIKLFSQREVGDIQQLIKIIVEYCECDRIDDAASIYRILLKVSSGACGGPYPLGCSNSPKGMTTEFPAPQKEFSPTIHDRRNLFFSLARSLYKLGYYEDALLYFDSTIAQEPGHAEAYCDRGAVLARLTRHEEALLSYERAIRIDPQLAEAHANRGTALGRLHRYDDALAAFDRAIAIRPDIAAFHHNRGVMLASVHRYDDALRSYECLAVLLPDDATVHYNVAVVLAMMERYEDALVSYDRCIGIDHNLSAAHSNRGLVLIKLNRYEEALESYAEAKKIAPFVGDILFNMGIALGKLYRYNEALQSYDEAIALRPNFAEAHCNRGLVLSELGRNEEAVASHDLAIAIKPDCADLYSNRGVALARLNRHQDALINYDLAIRARPDSFSAHWNKSRSLLSLGEYMVGWRYFEWRKFRGRRIPSKVTCPETVDWRAMENKNILVYWEEGLGDTIQFCRYLPMVLQIVKSVSFSVPAELFDLFANSFPGVTMVLEHQISDKFDFCCAMMSLPLVFGTTLRTIPRGDPYLFAPADKTRAFAHRLGVRIRPRVGLVWNGGFRPEQPEVRMVNQRRNIDFSVFSELNIPGIDFFSLQKGEPAESKLGDEQSQYWKGSNFFNFASFLNDFSDTAGLIGNLDLVISVDTSTAHLAAAMGKPVWILNRFDGCWRWLTGRTDSPWYPTVRLFNQADSGAWPPVISEVRDKLNQHFFFDTTEAKV